MLVNTVLLLFLRLAENINVLIPKTTYKALISSRLVI